MPELPEVETIRRGLEERLMERSITAIEVRVPNLFKGDPQLIYHQPILALERFGKLLVFRFRGAYVLTVHLKMTGQLIWKPADKEEEVEDIDNAEVPFDVEEDEDEADEMVMGGHPEQSYLQPLPHKHTHIIITFDDGSKLYFNDLRKFGRMEVVLATALKQVGFLQKLGPEPLSPAFTLEYLQGQLLKRPKVAVKSFLLDQSNIAGLGNIYADESLFRAAILPDRAAASLTKGEVRNLHEAIEETLELALLHGGSSSRDYVNAVGEKGTFLKISNVYHREGLDCNRCLAAKIVRKKIAGRSAHFCPVCQR